MEQSLRTLTETLLKVEESLRIHQEELLSQNEELNRAIADRDKRLEEQNEEMVKTFEKIACLEQTIEQLNEMVKGIK